MLVLHTSDWHLGRAFHGASLLDEQRRALSRVVEIAATEAVDVVVISGDIYDRAIPSTDAVDLLAEALGELRATGAVVVAITGNHDSPNRVGALDPLLRAGGVTLRGRFDPEAPVIVPATDGGPDLVIHPIPYLEPLAAPGTPRRGADDSAGRPRRVTQHDVVAHAMDAVRADLARRGPVRSVVVAHAFVAGAAPSASERELSVGGVDRVPTSVFDGVGYAALGHLHQPQVLSERIAYSGSLLPYSFSETHPCSVRLVEMGADGAVRSRIVEHGAERGVVTITGRLDELLVDPSKRGAEGCWVRAVLTDEVIPRHAIDRLRDRFPHTVVLEHRAPRRVAPADDVRHQPEATDLDLALAFVSHQLGRDVEPAEAALVRRAFDRVAARRREQSAPVSRPLVARADDSAGSGAVA